MKDIDTAMKWRQPPDGPLELADFIGLDTLAVMQVLYDGLADTKYARPLLVKYVRPAGWAANQVRVYDCSGDQPVPTR